MATLLLIDPNPATRSVLKTSLIAAGHQVEGVGGLIAARGVLARARPDLVLVDLGHPRAGETLQGLGSLPGVSCERVMLVAHAEDLASLPQPDLARPYRAVARNQDDQDLLEAIARHLNGHPGSAQSAPRTSPASPPGAVPLTTPDEVLQAPAAPALAAPVMQPVVRLGIPGPIESLPPIASKDAESRPEHDSGDLASLYKDVGFELEAVRRTLLYCDLHRLNDINAGLPAQDQKEVLAALLRKLEQAILSYDGRVCMASRNGFAVLFDLEGGGAETDARPFQAAIEMVFIAQQFCGWLRHRFPARGRQDFAIGVALDAGDLDFDEGSQAVLDPEIRRAITRLAHFAALGGQRGWTLTGTAEAMQTAAQTCSAGEKLNVVDVEGVRTEIFEVGAVALDSTTSVHERIARILQSNSALLRLGSPPAAAHDGAQAAGSSDPHSASRAKLAPAPMQGPAGQAGEASLSEAGNATLFDVPGYKVLRPLGKGGMAEVFLATHLATGEERVLKMLPINDGEEEQLQRFIQEYALISQIRDSNVARIHEQGFTQTHAYIAMEFLPGGELRGAMKGGVSVEQTLDWAQAIAGALMAVHAKGIAHRDLKPANLMFRADRSLVLADFGIAKGQSDLLNRTASGHIVGSPYYLSPEQAESKPVDARCDLYSLGVIIFELLTGKKPFRASNLSDLIRQHVVAPIPTLPEEFAAFQPLIDRLLAKRPSDRIASATLVLNELKALSVAQDPTQIGTTGFTHVGEPPRTPAPAVLRDVYSVAVIGFDETEKIVLSSTLGLSVRRTPRFIEFESSRADRPDIYLVDARDLLYLQTMLASNLDRAVPTVLIGSSDFGTGWPVLKRPLQWAKIFEAFDRVLTEQESRRHAVVS